jgi:hypothetical protein
MELPYGKEFGFFSVFKANESNVISGHFGLEDLGDNNRLNQDFLTLKTIHKAGANKIIMQRQFEND